MLRYHMFSQFVTGTFYNKTLQIPFHMYVVYIVCTIFLAYKEHFFSHRKSWKISLCLICSKSGPRVSFVLHFGSCLLTNIITGWKHCLYVSYTLMLHVPENKVISNYVFSNTFSSIYLCPGALVLKAKLFH